MRRLLPLCATAAAAAPGRRVPFGARGHAARFAEAPRALWSGADMPARLAGVIFDMDGTLVKQKLDFAKMYAAVGVPRDQDIIAVVEAIEDETKREEAWSAIDAVEAEAAETMVLMEGAAELARFLHDHNVPMALVTRNSRTSIDLFEARCWSPHGLPPLQPTLCRRWGGPPKPAPDPLLHIARTWGVPIEHTLMVGDSPSNDVAAGKAAGSMTALVDSDRRHFESPSASLRSSPPDFHVSALAHLIPQLQARLV